MAIFDCAIWRPVGNTRGDAIAPNLGLVLHHAVADGSLYGRFNDPASEVSANFWVSQAGTIEQYVDSSVQSWHGMSLNQRYNGVETEGCSQYPYADPMSDAMVRALATLYAEGHRRHGWTFTLANSDGQPGFGYHRMAVNTACPCDVRLNRRQEILDLASGQTPTPQPVLTPEDEHMDSVVAPNGDIVSHYRTPQNHLLEVTRSAGKQGSSPNTGLSIIDITNAFPQFQVES
jgi:hypothetical protein